MDPASSESIRRVYDAFNRRDWDSVFALLADDFTWTFDPQGFLTGTYSGGPEIRRAVEEFVDVWDDFRVEIDGFVDLDANHIGVDGRVVGRGKGSDLPIELTETVVWTLRGDEVVEAREYLGTPADLHPVLEAQYAG